MAIGIRCQTCGMIRYIVRNTLCIPPCFVRLIRSNAVELNIFTLNHLHLSSLINHVPYEHSHHVEYEPFHGSVQSSR